MPLILIQFESNNSYNNGLLLSVCDTKPDPSHNDHNSELTVNITGNKVLPPFLKKLWTKL